MPPKRHPTLFVPTRKGRVKINPDLLPELAAYLVMQMVRANDAARTQQRMMQVMPDGSATTSPAYYRHAAGYIRHLLYRLPDTLPADMLAEARGVWDRSQTPKDDPPTASMES